MNIKRSSTDLRALLLLTLVVLGTSLPFVSRAYFVDDYYFVTMAKGILKSPWRPYDFKSDDAGIGNVAWERGRRPRMVNPPLFHYYLAGVMALFGDAPWKLRTSSLLFSLAAVFCMYFLGKRLVPDALSPTLLMAICPAYWLTSYSLLIDSALLAFLLASLLTFFIGHERKKMGWIVISGFLMGLTMLVKYFGVLVLALALAWQLMDPSRRRWIASYIAYGCFLAVQLAWGGWNIVTYGQMHFLAALPRGMQSPSVVAWAQKALVMGSFMGGGLIFVLAAPFLLWRYSKTWVGALGVLGAVFFFLFNSKMGGFNPLQSFLLALFVTGSFAFLAVMDKGLNPSGDRRHLFLVLWALGGLFELVAVMPWTAGRYFLCVLPALCWILSVAFQALSVDRIPLRKQKLWHMTIGVTAIMGLLLAHADFVEANTIVRLAEFLKANTSRLQATAPRPPNHWYYLADTFDGSQPYLLPLGWENVLPHQKFHRGDLFLRAYYRKSSWWNVDEELKQFKPVIRYDVQSWNPLRVMDVPASAGFYASCWGALPWMITDHPLERFELYQAQ